MNARPFVFGADFGANDRRRRADDERHAAELAATERDAYARGREAGLAEARQEQTARLADAAVQVGGAALLLLEDGDRRQAAVETDAQAFFETLARAVAGGALAAQPLGSIAAAGAEAFRHVRGAPHLAVRVHESLVEPVDGLFRRLARERGFEGRVIVLGDDATAPGDARIEWADGGVVIDRASIDAAVASVLAQSGMPGHQAPEPGFPA